MTVPRPTGGGGGADDGGRGAGRSEIGWGRHKLRPSGRPRAKWNKRTQVHCACVWRHWRAGRGAG
eukprot:12970390-Alexandrium_andersonii.AAC.1